MILCLFDNINYMITECLEGREFRTVNTEMFAELLRNVCKKHTKMIPRTSVLTAVKKLT